MLCTGLSNMFEIWEPPPDSQTVCTGRRCGVGRRVIGTVEGANLGPQRARPAEERLATQLLRRTPRAAMASNAAMR